MQNLAYIYKYEIRLIVPSKYGVSMKKNPFTELFFKTLDIHDIIIETML